MTSSLRLDIIYFMATNFRSHTDLVNFVRTKLKSVDPKVSVGSTPISAGERHAFGRSCGSDPVFIRLSAEAPEFNEVRDYLTSLNITKHNRIDTVSFELTKRTANQHWLTTSHLPVIMS